jgi:hypothetical protein
MTERRSDSLLRDPVYREAVAVALRLEVLPREQASVDSIIGLVKRAKIRAAKWMDARKSSEQERNDLHSEALGEARRSRKNIRKEEIDRLDEMLASILSMRKDDGC